MATFMPRYARGNKYKIFQDHVKYNLRKYFFSNRVIQTWNSLPDFVVASVLVLLIVLKTIWISFGLTKK